NPGISVLDVYTQFFLQFASERVKERLARVYLATGKLPVTRIRFAFWPAGQEEGAIRPRNYRSGDVNDIRRLRHAKRIPTGSCRNLFSACLTSHVQTAMPRARF